MGKDKSVEVNGKWIHSKNGFLDLSGNDIHQLDEVGGFMSLTSVTRLDLSKNKLKEFPHLEHLPCLKSLNLWGNRITNIDGLSPLKNLIELGLAGNHVEDISPLGTLENLEILDLGSVNPTNFEPISNLSNLVFLNLAGNKFSEIEHLDCLPLLKYLYLGYNNVTKIKGLENLENLVELSLQGNKIKKIEGLKELINLEKLDLSINSVEKIEGLETLGNLRVLDLRGNKITSIGGLNNLTRLKMLKISSNPLDCSTFEMELQALPFLENIFVGPDQKLLDIVGRTLNTYITDEKTLGYMFLLEFWKGRKEKLLEEASIRERNDDLEGSLLILENPCDFDLSESEIDLKIKELKKRIAEKEYFKALKYEEDGELEKALIAYKTSLKHGLHDPNIYYNMSYLLIDNNDYKGAVDSLTKYVALVPSDKEARKKLESLKHVFRGLKS